MCVCVCVSVIKLVRPRFQDRLPHTVVSSQSVSAEPDNLVIVRARGGGKGAPLWPKGYHHVLKKALMWHSGRESREEVTSAVLDPAESSAGWQR